MKSCCIRKQGAALVIVLALVVLLTGLVMAFFSQAMSNRKLSNSSANQTKVDELARSAFDIVAADLKQEIVNGSLPFPLPPEVPRTFEPTSPANAGPQRTVPASAGLGVLLRTSTPNGVTTPGVDHAASSASTLDQSLNGRTISRARWNSHYLLPRPNGATSTSTAPVPGFDSYAPNWVFVTTDGPVSLTAPPVANGPQVIGRYAFAIYDEGALLNANVAGYPSTLQEETTNPVPSAGLAKIGTAGKGALALADLRELLPSTLSTGEKTKQIDQLVGWRDYATLNTTGDIGDYQFPSISGGLFFNSIWNNKNGFLSVDATPWNNRSNQAFVTRRQLIDFVLANGLSAEILQSLSSFNRALMIPSWGPSINSAQDSNFRGGSFVPLIASVPYKDEANDSTSRNRFIPNVVLPAAAAQTIRHYNDDGTFEDVPVAPGDPLIQRRFSLAKLAWLGTDGPNVSAFDPGLTSSQREAAILACFGLVWHPNSNAAGFSSNARWDYAALASGTPIAIKTLNQVVTENREPNFFELLAAGILDGSLGKDPGESATGFGGNPGDIATGPAGTLFYTLDSSGNPGGYSYNKAHHILRIGANIIDQADADSYPTTIFAPYPGYPGSPTIPSEELASTMFGIENLPYLHRLNHVGFCDPRNSTVNAASPYAINGYWHFWWRPELWNPHQAPSGTNSRPTQFRARAYGTVISRLTGGATGAAPIVDFDTNPVYTGSGSNRTDGGSFNDGKTFRDLYFSDPGGMSSPFYGSPRMIYNDPTNGNNIVDDVNTAAINRYDPAVNRNVQKLQATENGQAPAAGIFFGSKAHIRSNRTTAVWINSGAKGQTLDPWGYTVALEWQDSSGGWRPYTAMNRLKVELETNLSGNTGTRFDGASNPGSRSFLHVPDPRTDRFSASATENSGQIDLERTMVTGATGTVGRVMKYYPKGSVRGFVINGASGKYLHYFMMNKPDLGGANTAYYADRDGVVRPGDAYHTEGTGTGPTLSGDGLFLYHAGDAASTASATRRRPVLLDRPFRSVAELGYAFRDLPGKSLDFWSTSSADSGLLDLFAVHDEPPVVASQINLTNAPIPVMKALIAGAMKNQTPLSTMSTTDADKFAQALVSRFQTTPITNRSDLPAALNQALASIVHPSPTLTKSSPLNEFRNKAIAEAPLRSLSSVANTRTWNLMIDLVAQVGSFAPGAPATPAALNRSFVVTGERRYWLHIAIDRVTGKVIGQELESVYE